jgi:hypothetical protein
MGGGGGAAAAHHADETDAQARAGGQQLRRQLLHLPAHVHPGGELRHPRRQLARLPRVRRDLPPGARRVEVLPQPLQLAAELADGEELLLLRGRSKEEDLCTIQSCIQLSV